MLLRLPSLKSRPKSTLRRVLWLLAEFVVVFTGVYAAFLLDGYRSDLRDAEQREQILFALENYFTALSEDFDRSVLHMEAEVDTFHHRLRGGERPPLNPDLSYSGFSSGFWESMVQAGGLDVLPPRFIFEMEVFLSNLRAAIVFQNQLNELKRELLIPNLDAGEDEFYDLRTDSLRRKYAWYPQHLRQMHGMAQWLQQKTDSMTVELNHLLDE